MYHMDDFLQWCIDTHGHSLQFSSNHKKSIILYCKLIEKIYRNKHYIHSLMKGYSIVESQNKKRNIMKTLRMTIQG